MSKSLLLFLLLSLLLLFFTSTTTIYAKAPPLDCKCYNGGVRTTPSNRCRCDCSSITTNDPATGDPYIAPYCVFSSTSKVKLAITWDNSTTPSGSSFSLDITRNQLRAYLANQFPSTSDFDPQDDLNWVQRVQRNEDSSKNEVVVMYLIKGHVVETLMDAIADGDKITIASGNGFTYNAKDSFIMGLTVAAPGVFAQHWSSGRVLASFTTGNLFGDSYKDIEMNLSDRHVEFVIGAFAVLLFCPVFENVLMYAAFHPEERELRREEEEAQAKIRKEQRERQIEAAKRIKKARAMGLAGAGGDFDDDDEQNMDNYIDENHNTHQHDGFDNTFSGTTTAHGSPASMGRGGGGMRRGIVVNPLSAGGGRGGDGDGYDDYDDGEHHQQQNYDGDQEQQENTAPVENDVFNDTNPYGYHATSEPTTPVSPQNQHMMSSSNDTNHDVIMEDAGNSVNYNNHEDLQRQNSMMRKNNNNKRKQSVVAAKPKPKAFAEGTSKRVMNFSDFM